MKRVLLGVSLALLLSAPFMLPSRASAHFLGCSSVEGGDIHWQSSTIFTTARNHAVAQWDGLGSVNIAPDTIWTAAETKFIDFNQSDTTVVGLYTDRDCGNGDDRIRLNRFWMDRLSDAQRRNVALHELGHALGLGHSFSGNVMNPFVTSQTTLGTHDIEDYWALWGRPFGPGGSDRDPKCGPVAC